MPLELVSTLAALRRLEGEWEALPLPSPMQSPAWLVSWWEACGEPDPSCELATLAVRDLGGELVGIAPWYLRTSAVAGASLRFLGDGRASTDHHTLLCRKPEDEPAVVAAAASWLVETAGCAWRRVRFEALDSDDRATTHLERILAEAGLDTERVTACGAYAAELAIDGVPATWDDYLARLSKNRRKRMRRWERDYFDTGRVAVRVAESEGDLEQLWPILVGLHRERREALGHAGVFDEPAFNAFHRLASRRLLAERRLRLAVLELDGAPAAVEYALQDPVGQAGAAVYAYQGGISGRGAEEDAGHVSLMALARDALEAGRTRLDLLRGDEPYKLSWGATCRPTLTLHVRPRDAAGTLERWAGNAYRVLRDRALGTSNPADRVAGYAEA